MEDLRKPHKPPSQYSDKETRVRIEADEEKKKLVVLYHVESVYNTKANFGCGLKRSIQHFCLKRKGVE